MIESDEFRFQSLKIELIFHVLLILSLFVFIFGDNKSDDSHINHLNYLNPTNTRRFPLLSILKITIHSKNDSLIDIKIYLKF